ncbi:MAG: hypothetical protein EOO65_05570 [Methanosarcinales archaeon]|nr:MAG: hypothetical protein EOO65_05570 [Methanosarcinales archaeon]
MSEPAHLLPLSVDPESVAAELGLLAAWRRRGATVSGSEREPLSLLLPTMPWSRVSTLYTRLWQRKLSVAAQATLPTSQSGAAAAATLLAEPLTDREVLTLWLIENTARQLDEAAVQSPQSMPNAGMDTNMARLARLRIVAQEALAALQTVSRASQADADAATGASLLSSAWSSVRGLWSSSPLPDATRVESASDRGAASADTSAQPPAAATLIPTGCNLSDSVWFACHPRPDGRLDYAGRLYEWSTITDVRLQVDDMALRIAREATAATPLSHGIPVHGTRARASTPRSLNCWHYLRLRLVRAAQQRVLALILKRQAPLLSISVRGFVVTMTQEAAEAVAGPVEAVAPSCLCRGIKVQPSGNTIPCGRFSCPLLSTWALAP